MTPGWKTTEFWVTAAVTLWGAFSHVLPAWAQALVTTVAPAAYTIGRSIAKAAENGRPVHIIPGPVPMPTAETNLHLGG